MPWRSPASRTQRHAAGQRLARAGARGLGQHSTGCFRCAERAAGVGRRPSRNRCTCASTSPGMRKAPRSPPGPLRAPAPRPGRRRACREPAVGHAQRRTGRRHGAARRRTIRRRPARSPVRRPSANEFRHACRTCAPRAARWCRFAAGSGGRRQHVVVLGQRRVAAPRRAQHGVEAMRHRQREEGVLERNASGRSRPPPWAAAAGRCWTARPSCARPSGRGRRRSLDGLSVLRLRPSVSAMMALTDMSMKMSSSRHAMLVHQPQRAAARGGMDVVGGLVALGHAAFGPLGGHQDDLEAVPRTAPSVPAMLGDRVDDGQPHHRRAPVVGRPGSAAAPCRLGKSNDKRHRHHLLDGADDRAIQPRSVSARAPMLTLSQLAPASACRTASAWMPGRSSWSNRPWCS
jgi:hypothetical protein